MLCELIIKLGYTNLDSYCMTHHAIYYVIFIHPFQVWMKLQHGPWSQRVRSSGLKQNIKVVFHYSELEIHVTQTLAKPRVALKLSPAR